MGNHLLILAFSWQISFLWQNVIKCNKGFKFKNLSVNLILESFNIFLMTLLTIEIIKYFK